MILRAGGDMVMGKRSEKPFQLLLAGHRRSQTFDIVAISGKPHAVTVFSGQSKMLAASDFSEPLQSLSGVHGAILIHEPQFVY